MQQELKLKLNGSESLVVLQLFMLSAVLNNLYSRANILLEIQCQKKRYDDCITLYVTTKAKKKALEKRSSCKRKCEGKEEA